MCFWLSTMAGMTTGLLYKLVQESDDVGLKPVLWVSRSVHFTASSRSHSSKFLNSPTSGPTLCAGPVISVTVEPGVDVPNLNAGLNTQPAASTATPTPVAKRTLAFTGTTTFTLLAVAVLFISLGAGFMVVTRRRSHAH